MNFFVSLPISSSRPKLIYKVQTSDASMALSPNAAQAIYGFAFPDAVVVGGSASVVSSSTSSSSTTTTSTSSSSSSALPNALRYVSSPCPRLRRSVEHVFSLQMSSGRRAYGYCRRVDSTRAYATSSRPFVGRWGHYANRHAACRGGGGTGGGADEAEVDGADMYDDDDTDPARCLVLISAENDIGYLIFPMLRAIEAAFTSCGIEVGRLVSKKEFRVGADDVSASRAAADELFKRLVLERVVKCVDAVNKAASTAPRIGSVAVVSGLEFGPNVGLTNKTSDSIKFVVPYYSSVSSCSDPRPSDYFDVSNRFHTPLMPLLRCLGIASTLRLLSALLSERRIVLTSASVPKLSSCIHGAMALLSPVASGPLSWQHVFIPLLPRNLLSYVSAPMPYVIGMLAAHMPLLNQLGQQSLGEIVVVDLDTGELRLLNTTDAKRFVPDLLVGSRRDVSSAGSGGGGGGGGGGSGGIGLGAQSFPRAVGGPGGANNGSDEQDDQRSAVELLVSDLEAVLRSDKKAMEGGANEGMLGTAAVVGAQAVAQAKNLMSFFGKKMAEGLKELQAAVEDQNGLVGLDGDFEGGTGTGSGGGGRSGSGGGGSSESFGGGDNDGPTSGSSNSFLDLGLMGVGGPSNNPNAALSKKEETEEDLYSFPNPKEETSLRIALVSFYVYIIGDPRLYLKRETDGKIVFDRPAFLQKRRAMGDGEGLAECMNLFGQSQMFEIFVENRIKMQGNPGCEKSDFFKFTELLLQKRLNFEVGNIKRCSKFLFAEVKTPEDVAQQKVMDLTSNTAFKGDWNATVSTLCRVSKEVNGVLRVVMASLWLRLKDSKGMRWRHAYFSLLIMKQLLLEGPPSALAELDSVRKPRL